MATITTTTFLLKQIFNNLLLFFWSIISNKNKTKRSIKKKKKILKKALSSRVGQVFHMPIAHTAQFGIENLIGFEMIWHKSLWNLVKFWLKYAIKLYLLMFSLRKSYLIKKLTYLNWNRNQKKKKKCVLLLSAYKKC